MRARLASVLAFVFIVAASFARPALAGAPLVDWPHFRFNEHHTGFNPKEAVLSKRNIIFAGVRMGRPARRHR